MKLPDQARAKIRFEMKGDMLSVSFVGSNESADEVLETVQGSMPSDERYYLYMRAPPGVHDVKFHEVSISKKKQHKTKPCNSQEPATTMSNDTPKDSKSDDDSKKNADLGPTQIEASPWRSDLESEQGQRASDSHHGAVT